MFILNYFKLLQSIMRSLSNLIFCRFTSSKIISLILALLKLVLSNIPVKLAPIKLVFFKLALVKFTPCKSAYSRLTPVKLQLIN